MKRSPRAERKVNQRMRKPRGEMRGQMGFVPTVMTNTILGATSRGSVTQHGKEIIGYIDVNSSTPSGLLAEILANPLLMGAPRLEKMAAIYQQYRFRKLRFTLATVLPTTTYGQFWLAYTRNPDHRIANDVEANANVFALENSRQCQAWTPATYDCALSPNTTIFNIDNDSREIMKTTQGKFFIATSGQFNLTGTYTIPVYLEYEIELFGQSALPTQDGSAIIFPATVYSGPTDATGTLNLRLAPGETIDYPWNRGMKQNVPYYCIPAFDLQLGDDPAENVLATIVEWDGNTSGFFRFFETLDDYDTRTFVVVRADAVDIENERFTIEQVTDTLSAVSAFKPLSSRYRVVERTPVPTKARPSLRVVRARQPRTDWQMITMPGKPKLLGSHDPAQSLVDQASCLSLASMD